MGISKVTAIAVAAAVLIGGTVFFLRERQKGTVLRVCTWSNYFPDSVIAEFTAKTGIRVQLNYISSNEELFAKLRAGATGFDVIMPSDYMVRQMRGLSMLREVDKSQLTHLANLDPQFVNLPYDPGLKHSVPFAWGSTGLTVDTALVKVEGPTVSWAMLFDSPEPRRTSMLDDMREAFAAFYFWQGLPTDTYQSVDLSKAAQQFAITKSHILMFSSEPRPLLLRGELAVAHSFSTDGYQAKLQKNTLRYFIPKEGGTLWVDTFAIPKTTENTLDAHRFIDFFLDEDVALKTFTINQSATPNAKARVRLPKEMREDPHFYPPPETMRRLKMLEDPKEMLETMNRLWTELKS